MISLFHTASSSATDGRYARRRDTLCQCTRHYATLLNNILLQYCYLFPTRTELELRFRKDSKFFPAVFNHHCTLPNNFTAGGQTMGGKYSKMDPMDVEVPELNNQLERDPYLKPYEREFKRR